MGAERLSQQGRIKQAGSSGKRMPGSAKRFSRPSAYGRLESVSY
jgi:hypothetical protein